jgi:hypothetical protein
LPLAWIIGRRSKTLITWGDLVVAVMSGGSLLEL